MRLKVKTSMLSMVLLALVLGSCSTDVDIYADYKDFPVVYGLINAQVDTNFVKITKAFCGSNDTPSNAFDMALVYDSSNYPGKLDAFIEELKSSQGEPFQFTGRRFFLDTITIHDKKPGVFYSPHQKVYYTTERFNTNSDSNKYRYKLYVVKPDGDTVTAETSVVGGDISVMSTTASFQFRPSNAESKLFFTSTEEAVLYEFGMRFNYREVHPGQPEEKKEVSWGFSARPLSGYEKVDGSENIYMLYYSPNVLFNYLKQAIGNDTIWDENHPNVIRYIDDFELLISAAGEDFNNYYQYLQVVQHGLSLSSDYSNINGGCGLFSSRIFIKKTMDLSAGARFDLFRLPWGFQEQ